MDAPIQTEDDLRAFLRELEPEDDGEATMPRVELAVLRLWEQNVALRRELRDARADEGGAN